MQTETSEVMTLWGYTNLFIIIIIINSVHNQYSPIDCN